MHFIPYYKNKNWQRFFVGLFIGAIISYFIFIYMYGQLLEKRIEENLQLRIKKQELKLNYRTLEENMSDLNQKYQEKLLVHSVEITIINAETFKLDRFSIHELKELMMIEVSDIVGKEVTTLTEHYPLLIRSIENKTYKINDFSYRAKIKHLFINEQSQIHIELDF